MGRRPPTRTGRQSPPGVVRRELGRVRTSSLGALTAAFAIGAGLGACGGGDDDLKVGDTGSIGSIEDLTPKQRDVSLGAITIDEPGREVEVLRVRALTSPNVVFLGAITTWPRDGRTSALGSGLGFPVPTMTFHSAIGTVVPASETSYVIPGESEPRSIFVGAGFRLNSGRVGAVHAIEVTYRVGNKTRIARSRTADLLCMAPCNNRPEELPLRGWEAQISKQLGVVTSDTKDLPAKG